MAKVIFIGTSHFALPVLEGLVKNDYQILAVITAPDRPSGRKNQITPPPVKEIALKHKLRILQPEKISEIEKKLNEIEHKATGER